MNVRILSQQGDMLAAHKARPGKQDSKFARHTFSFQTKRPRELAQRGLWQTLPSLEANGYLAILEINSSSVRPLVGPQMAAVFEVAAVIFSGRERARVTDRKPLCWPR